jgi:hypothetical protein
MGVGIEHDTDGLALVGWASGRSTGGGRRQQPSEQRIFVAYVLVGHYGDLTVVRRRDERDDAPPLEKAEDAFARALDDGLDVLLGRCRGQVEHETLPVAVWRV